LKLDSGILMASLLLADVYREAASIVTTAQD
jgi:hypothetical protein